MKIGIIDICVWSVASYVIFYAYVEPMLFRRRYLLRLWARLIVYYPLCIVTAPASLPFFIIAAVAAVVDWLRYTVAPAIDPDIRH